MAAERSPLRFPEIPPLLGRRAQVAVVTIGSAFAAWYLLATIYPQNLMPYPSTVFVAAWELFETGSLQEHLYASAWRIFWSFLGAFVIGAVIGILAGISDFGSSLTSPYVVIGFSIPTVVWAAMMTLIFGFEFLAPVVATILGTVPYIATNIEKGIENIDMNLVRMTRSFEVSRLRMLHRVTIPNIAPAIFGASRIGLSISYKIMAVAEMFAASNGIGYMIFTTYSRYRFTETWAWGLVFVIIVVFLEIVVFRPLEKRAFDYRSDTDI